MKRCSKCVNPSTRPNIFFNEEGLCPVCVFEDQKLESEINWDERDLEMQGIIDWAKTRKQTQYDCIVTVSGGKDSTRQAMFARDNLKLNPLLVSVMYTPEHGHYRGPKNLSNLTSLGFDVVSMSLNPKIWKDLIRNSFYKSQNIFNTSEMALYAIPVHIGIAYKIPLIFLGENPALTIGEQHGKLDGDASQMRNANTLQGGSPRHLMNKEMTDQDVHFYNYPSERDVIKGQLKLVYLGYYDKDWSGKKNGEFAVKNGLVTRNDPPEEIGDLWGISALDEDFRIVNQMIKFMKYGFGHVTDQVIDAIHLGDISKKEGMELIKKYDGKCHERYIKKFCKYIDIPEIEFWTLVEKTRNKKLFKKDSEGKWQLNYE